MDDRIRSFLAIELSEAALAAVERALADLHPTGGPDVKWIPVRNAHLTLHFFGSESRARLEAAARALRAADLGVPYEAELGGVGAFPDLRAPRIIWIGLTRGGAETIELQRNAMGALAGLGFSPEPRPFHPHVTIGRLRPRSRAPAALRRTARLPGLVSPGAFRVTALSLMQSRLGGPVPVYEPIERVAIGKSAGA